MKKSLVIPYAPELDELHMEEIGRQMETYGRKSGINCNNWATSFPYEPLAAFLTAYSDNYIYVDFFVRGNYLKAENYTNNSPVSEDSCVEFFLRLPSSAEYWNFEFNCIGTINASHRERRDGAIRLTDEQLAMVKRYASCGTRPFHEMEGLFAWNLIIAIPFKLLGVNSVDEIPEYIEGNFYKCGSKTSSVHYLSWSPIGLEKPNFHCPEFFGTLNLAKR
ncbi:MAG: carbohydrate-binding family 9-like protein [Bacteroidales bacterium]